MTMKKCFEIVAGDLNNAELYLYLLVFATLQRGEIIIKLFLTLVGMARCNTYVSLAKKI